MAGKLTVFNAKLFNLAQLLKIGYQLGDDLWFIYKSYHIEEVEYGQAMHLCILVCFFK